MCININTVIILYILHQEMQNSRKDSNFWYSSFVEKTNMCAILETQFNPLETIDTKIDLSYFIKLKLVSTDAYENYNTLKDTIICPENQNYITLCALNLKLPFSTTHRAMCLWCLRIHPFQDTVQMKCVIACTPNCK